MILVLFGIALLLIDFFIGCVDNTGKIAIPFHVFTCFITILILLGFQLYK